MHSPEDQATLIREEEQGEIFGLLPGILIWLVDQ
jgi:hypothetical protein